MPFQVSVTWIWVGTGPLGSVWYVVWMIGRTSTVSELYVSERLVSAAAALSVRPQPQLHGGAGSMVIEVCWLPLNGLICPVAKSLYCVWLGSGVTGWPLGQPGELADLAGATTRSTRSRCSPGPSAMPSGLDLVVGSVYWVIDPAGRDPAQDAGRVLGEPEVAVGARRRCRTGSRPAWSAARTR